MPGFTNAEAKATLDQRFPTSGSTESFVAYSANGTTETSAMPRTSVGATGWAASTDADPSVKANGIALTTAEAVGEATITHWCVMSAGTGGTQRIEWHALTQSKTVTPGDQLKWAVGELKITLT